jgi:hypothetical protein
LLLRVVGVVAQVTMVWTMVEVVAQAGLEPEPLYPLRQAQITPLLSEGVVQEV